MSEAHRRPPLVAALLVALGGLAVAVGGWLEWGRLVPGDGGDPFVVKGSWVVIGAGALLALLGVALAAVRGRRFRFGIAVVALLGGLPLGVMGIYGAFDDFLIVQAAAERASAGATGDVARASLRSRAESEIRVDVDLGRTGVRVGAGLWWLAAGGLAAAGGGAIALGARAERHEAPAAAQAATLWEGTPPSGQIEADGS